MAAIVDAVVGDLATQLVHFVEENASLTVGIKGEIEELLTDLKTFGAILKQASKNEGANDNDVLKDAVENMRNLKTDAEDAISKYTVEKRKHKDKGIVMRKLEAPVYYAKVNGLAKEIQAIKKRVAKIRQDNAQAIQELIHNPNRDGQPTLPRMAPVVEEEDVVGFAEEARVIKNRLINGSDNLTFISIKGMAGLGKTTLTKMVYKDRDLQHDFFTCIWVYVSRTFNRRLIFLDILSNFTKETKKFHDMTDETLSEKIQEFLGDNKYFIVMDDVWTVKDWDCLKIAFSNNKKGSRVLVTTRHEKVASHIDSDGKPHQLKFLTNNESWELLAKKVFRKERCPSFLETPGMCIAIKCKGLPLAIVVIAGVLDKNSTANEWKKVAEDPFPVIGNQENQSYYELVKLSYDHLPVHLKDCFYTLVFFLLDMRLMPGN
ncbi:PREDICTED: putative disease resistance protein At1g50180 [Ipomoea nil]|uniref:putative disease resistance protein At1g50180 n=1 Tax=Ipomoea nil TaxID=35883 RepID=UPI000901BA07|nr:PREDICTED: putative disease resistance protein At1g50180 [Ipomoea nil]